MAVAFRVAREIRRRPPALLVRTLQLRINAMSGSTPDRQSGIERLHRDVQTEFDRLDTGCRTRLGVTAPMFRTAKFLFHTAVLVFAGYLIGFVGVPWEVAVTVSVLFIAGPEGLELYLVRQGVLADPPDSDSGGSES